MELPLIKKQAIINKGFGYIATNNISKGTIILEESPYVTSREHFGKYMFDEILSVIYCIVMTRDDDSEISLYNKFKTLAPNTLGEVERDQFFENFLKQLKKSESSFKKKILKHIKLSELVLLCLKYKRNVFIFNNKMGAIFYKASVFNHSCEPNCVFYDENNKMTFETTKDIIAGEEVTISYIDAEQHEDHRQFELNMTYGFQCKCALCNKN
jgi:hypothetical protein